MVSRCEGVVTNSQSKSDKCGVYAQYALKRAREILKMKKQVILVIASLTVMVLSGCNKFSEPKDLEPIQGKGFRQDTILGFLVNFSNYFVRDEGRDDVAYFMFPTLKAIIVGDLEIRNYSRTGHSGKFIIKELFDADNQRTKYEYISTRFTIIDENGRYIPDEDGEETTEEIRLYPNDSILFEIKYDNEIKKNVMIVTFENGTRTIFPQK
jgi:hypothetical protein